MIGGQLAQLRQRPLLRPPLRDHLADDALIRRVGGMRGDGELEIVVRRSLEVAVRRLADVGGRLANDVAGHRDEIAFADFQVPHFEVLQLRAVLRQHLGLLAALDETVGKALERGEVLELEKERRHLSRRAVLHLVERRARLFRILHADRPALVQGRHLRRLRFLDLADTEARQTRAVISSGAVDSSWKPPRLGDGQRCCKLTQPQDPMTSSQRLEALARRRFSSPDRRRGFLIAFEGPDGSGKTTQRKLFKTWLESEGTTSSRRSGIRRPDQADDQGAQAARALSPEEFSLLHAADFRHRVEQADPARALGRQDSDRRSVPLTGLARDAARGLAGLDPQALSAALWPDSSSIFGVV